MNILIAILGLSFLILIHEMGHYWAARWLKIPVVNFSIGFGPALFTLHNKLGTSFTLRAILLGGYVKFWEPHMPNSKGKVFDEHPVWKRMITVIAGPLTNLICAYVFFVFLGLSGVTGLKPVVGEVLEDSIAAKAEILPGDTILSLNGAKVLLWQDFLWYALPLLGEPKVSIIVEAADKEILQKELNLASTSLGDIEKERIDNLIGITPKVIQIKPTIGGILEGSAAEKSGLQESDVILSINGEYIYTWREFSSSIQQSPDQELNLRVLRNDNIISINLTPAVHPDNPDKGLAGIRVKTPEIGTSIVDEYYTKAVYPLSQVWTYAFKQTSATLKLTVESLYQLLIGGLGLDSLGGPISIVQHVGVSVEVGMQSFIKMMAFINLSLFFFNLLPIPILDGGHLVTHIIEVLLRRKPSARFLRNYQTLGFALLVTLFIFVTFNDLSRLL
ncbi:MAG: RIP metalloprotease RseP [Candidatus Portiera sp.]|nr:RIP metalloprotease RseP [Portiera sp.]